MTPTAALPIADVLTSLRALCQQWAPEPDSNSGDYDTGIAHGQIECANQLGPIMLKLELASGAPAAQATADAEEAARQAVNKAAVEIRDFLGVISPRFPSDAELAVIIRKAVSPKAAQEDWKAKYDALYATINTPHTDEWFEAVRLEAGFQIERWGTEHDAAKAPMDWFWLIGYLAGKALASQLKGDMSKAKHHTISSGAALLNWFRAMTGDTNSMRPGHAPSAEAAGDVATPSVGEQEKGRE